MSTENRQHSLLGQLEVLLEKMELSSRERQIFLYLIKNSGITAAEVAKKNRSIPRTSVYDVLTALTNKGLISTVDAKDGVLYSAQNIEHIADVLERKKRLIEEQQQELRNAAHLFQALKAGGGYKPSVRFFEGEQGILAIQREIQNARQPTRTIVDIAAIARKFPSFISQDNLKDFQKYNIPKMDLMIKSREALGYLKVAPITDVHRVKWLPEPAQFHTDTILWDGHVAILDYEGDPSGVIIDNPAIYKTFLAWFTMMWESIEGEVNRSA